MILGELIEQNTEIILETVFDMRVTSKKDGTIHRVVLPVFMVPFFLLGGKITSHSSKAIGYYKIDMEVNDMNSMIAGAKVWEGFYNEV